VRPTAKPFVLAYLFLVTLTLAILVRRAPVELDVVSAVAPTPLIQAQQSGAPAPGAHSVGEDHSTTAQSALPPPPKKEPGWLQFFRPSQRMALQILHAGLPFLAQADGSSKGERISLLVYRTGPRGEAPRTFLQSLFPFLRDAETPSVQVPPVATKPDTPDPTVQHHPPKTPAPLAGGKPLIGIYHTHDWESYISEFPGLKLDRKEDLDLIESFDHQKRTVVNLGQKLATLLSQRGVVTVHSDQRHQRLLYDNAYLLSRETAEQILKEQPSTRVLIDIHRDAAWGYTPTAVIDGQEVAQIRCIIGDTNPGWRRNQEFCDRLMGQLNQLHPGLTLPTLVQDDRYNQDLLPGAILLEVGSATNTYAQAERAVALLADGLVAVAQFGSYPAP
jgi:stage II sporulation protein P